MIKLLLKLVKTETLWKIILAREGFGTEGKIESSIVWQEAFSRVPMLKDWLKRREVMLLKNLVLRDRLVDFIRGQLAETRLYQSFDIPGVAMPKVEETKVEELPEKEEFLKTWEGKK